MSVSFDSALTLQAATSHQCSRDANGDGEGGRNGYPSDSVEAALIRKKFDVDQSEDHDRMEKETFDSEKASCPSSEVDSSDGEGVGTTTITQLRFPSFCSSGISLLGRMAKIFCLISHTFLETGKPNFRGL